MSLCAVTGTILDGSENPIVGIVVNAFPISAPQNSPYDNAMIGRTVLQAITTSTGKFTLNLSRTVQFCINIKDIGYKEVLTVPDVAAIDLWTAMIATSTGYEPIPETSTGMPIVPTDTNW